MSMQRRSFAAALVCGLTACSVWSGAFDDFFVAVVRNDGRSITALIQRGFDPNTRDKKGQLGLVLALQNENLKAAAALIDSRKTDVSARNAQDESPLMMAAQKGQVDIVTAFTAAVASVNNLGPGLGEMIGPSGNFQGLNDFQTWVTIVLLLLGRLELFAVLILFTPQFWRR